MCPEVLRTSGGADVPAVVALHFAILSLSCKESNGYLDSGLMYRIAVCANECFFLIGVASVARWTQGRAHLVP